MTKCRLSYNYVLYTLLNARGTILLENLLKVTNLLFSNVCCLGEMMSDYDNNKHIVSPYAKLLAESIRVQNERLDNFCA